MKRTLFVLGCLAIFMASCASPEERAAANKAADSAKASTSAPATEAATTPATTDTAAKATTPAPAATTPAAPAAAAEKSKGEALIAKADCLACHSKTQKLVGPAYVNVAGKYPATDENIEHLADKIIAGGQGVWGAIPMTPHPTLSKDDAKEMVKYILSLKK
ncbi:cytochrome C552 [Pedobacter ginsengisoli]|uniref:Cytochrome C552 n=1 Tax=Pedobacter ginsengisoli TaxID=363852 RepID=A0A2D1U817_9SPHI|nr:c-type cytochrome [Pedobacter ginsengisoli]ATP57732.1 cytochrome C552 [Pedobacter ginsengisoli]